MAVAFQAPNRRLPPHFLAKTEEAAPKADEISWWMVEGSPTTQSKELEDMDGILRAQVVATALCRAGQLALSKTRATNKSSLLP